MASEECTTTEPIIVDGASGLERRRVRVAVTTAGRGYHIQLYTRGDVTQTPSLRMTGHGLRRSSPPCNSIPRMRGYDPSAPDPDLHLDATRHVSFLPQGMDRSSGDRALDGPHVPAPSITPRVDFLHHPILEGRPVPDPRLVADRRYHARGVARGAHGEQKDARQRNRSRRRAPDGLIGADTCEVAGVTTAGRGYEIQLYALTTTLPPSLPMTGRGSRRSSPPSNSIPRMPSTKSPSPSP